MAVDAKQHRIVSLKGKLMHDVKILGGFLGALNAGGTFDVERRETGGSVWQITETHVHIQGHVLIFKSISEQEDDVKTEFKQLPADISLEQAENDLLAEARISYKKQAKPSRSTERLRLRGESPFLALVNSHVSGAGLDANGRAAAVDLPDNVMAVEGSLHLHLMVGMYRTGARRGVHNKAGISGP